jgi:hypothetical protein
MIGEILAGVSALGSLLGTFKSAQANQNIDKQIRQRQSELDTWYNKEYNTPWLETPEGKSLVTLMNNQRDQTMKKVDQNNAITGASDETRVATADKVNRGTADTLARAAGTGGRYNQQILNRQYQGLKYGLDNLELQNLSNKNQQWGNFMNNAMNVGIGAAEATGGGAFNEWDNKLTGLWKKRKAMQAGVAAAGQIGH